LGAPPIVLPWIRERSHTQLSLDKDAPIPRPISPHAQGRIVAIPQVGGLDHRYERRAD
jgi:hypothetical protein